MSSIADHLLIFPGGGSPHNERYASVYRLLDRLGKSHGYTCIETLVWPGHTSGSVLTLDGALSTAQSRLDEIEAAGTDYCVLARSFGCIVALAACTGREHLKKLILWGPPPYWLLWEMFSRDFDRNREITLSKGTYIDKSFFPSLHPVESMLKDVVCETIVATGAADPYVPQFFLDYLASLARDTSKVRFKPAVCGASHEVAEDAPPAVIAAYTQALFT